MRARLPTDATTVPPDRPQSAPIGRGRCTATTKTGERCRTAARPGSVYCFAHDPELAERRKVGNRAGAARANAPRRRAVLPPGTPIPALRTTKEVVAFLERTIGEVRTGALDPKIASTVGYLVGIQARAVVEVESRESSPAPEPSRPMTPDKAATGFARVASCLARMIARGKLPLTDQVLDRVRASAVALLAALDGPADPAGLSDAHPPLLDSPNVDHAPAPARAPDDDGVDPAPAPRASVAIPPAAPPAAAALSADAGADLERRRT